MFESCAAAKLLAEAYQRVPLLCLGLNGRAVEKQFALMQRTLTDWLMDLYFALHFLEWYRRRKFSEKCLGIGHQG